MKPFGWIHWIWLIGFICFRVVGTTSDLCRCRSLISIDFELEIDANMACLGKGYRFGTRVYYSFWNAASMLRFFVEYIYMYIYIYVYIYICIFTYMYLFIYLFIVIYIYLYADLGYITPPQPQPLSD